MSEIPKTRPLVSAIIATYNRAHIVREAIDSILHQSYQNIDLVVVDDGSIDETQEVLSAYGARIRVVHQENSGPAAAWNRGIRESRGEIIAFLGSDDIWLPTFVERHVSVLDRAGENVPCSLSNSWLGYANGTGTTSFQGPGLLADGGEGIWLNPAEILATRFVLFGQSVAVRRCALDEVGLFDEKLWYLEDYDLALRLSVGKTWGLIREPLVVWRQSTADSLSQKGLTEFTRVAENRLRILERLIPTVHLSKESARLRVILARQLKQSQMELRAERIREQNNWGAEAIAKTIRFIGKCQNYVYKRSSSYPQIRFSQFAQVSPGQIDLAVSPLIVPKN
jgi:glycosyltransferase involved in cell wall biosynthesis